MIKETLDSINTCLSRIYCDLSVSFNTVKELEALEDHTNLCEDIDSLNAFISCVVNENQNLTIWLTIPLNRVV